MVLDARSNNGLFGGTNLPSQFSKDQILTLEGNFSEYFTLYCRREYERDTHVGSSARARSDICVTLVQPARATH